MVGHTVSRAGLGNERGSGSCSVRTQSDGCNEDDRVPREFPEAVGPMLGGKGAFWFSCWPMDPTSERTPDRGSLGTRQQASLDYKQRLQELFFPEGIAFDGIQFNRTAVTAPLFKYLAPSDSADEKMVTLNFASWNHVEGWLRRLESLRTAA